MKIVQLVQDVPTRWNSIFNMLQRLLEQRRAVTLYCAEKGAATNLDPEQWAIIETLVQLLMPFEEITRDISNTRASISLVIPAVKAMTTTLDHEGNDGGVKITKAELLRSMKKRFSALECSPLFSIATIVDPRFKMRCFSSEGVKISAKAGFLLVCEQRSRLTLPLTDGGEPEIKEPDAKRRCISDNSPWASLDDVLCTTVPDNELSTSPVETELATYLSESLLPRQEDPFLWWKSNRHRFPIMASVARIYLASPPTSVPSERVFSTAGDIVSDHRSRLLPENAERLILLKFNLHLLKSDC